MCSHARFLSGRLMRFVQKARLFSSQPKQTNDSNGPVLVSYNIYEPSNKSDKPPFLMTHGLLGSKLNWNTIAKAVAKKTDRRVITFDARNHGNSPHTSVISYTSMIQDILHLKEHLAIDRFSVLGHSMGGRTAMALALTHSSMIEKLVVVDISPYSAGSAFDNIKVYIDLMLSIQFQPGVSLPSARKIADEILKHKIEDSAMRAFLMTNLAKDKNNEVSWVPNLPLIATSLDEIKSFPKDLLGQSCPCPTLFIKGDLSGYIALDQIPLIQKNFPNSQLEILKNCGHWPQAENPNEFIKILIPFIE